jgi:Mlc titration factor MtfA (ptsG expression regulator)
MSWLTRILYLLGLMYLTYWAYYVYFEGFVLLAYKILPGVVLMMLVFVFSPQINWFWWKRFTPALYTFEKEWLMQHSAFYCQLDSPQKQKFEKRVFLFQKSVIFEVKGLESVPRDFISAISSQQVMLTFGEAQYLTEPFERFIIYRTHFPSPLMPTRHASEVHAGDGVVIFAGDQLLFSLKEREKFFNVGIYELAKIYQLQRKEKEFPLLNLEDKASLDSIAPYTREAAESQCQQPLEDDFAYAVHHFFQFPKEFQRKLPQLYCSLGVTLGAFADFSQA